MEIMEFILACSVFLGVIIVRNKLGEIRANNLAKAESWEPPRAWLEKVNAQIAADKAKVAAKKASLLAAEEAYQTALRALQNEGSSDARIAALHAGRALMAAQESYETAWHLCHSDLWICEGHSFSDHELANMKGILSPPLSFFGCEVEDLTEEQIQGDLSAYGAKD
jgi:hypothetical protein